MKPAEIVSAHNLDAERSVLGAILVTSGRAMDVVADVLVPESFFRVGHQHVFRAMVGLYTRGGVVDFVTVQEALRSARRLDEAGGPAYVASLAAGVPGSTNVAAYAQIVRDKATVRRVERMASSLLDSARCADADAAELINEAERELLDVSLQAVPGDLVMADEMVRAIYPEIERLHATRRPVTGLETGFRKLDLYTRGLQPGDLTIIAARPSKGKTTIATEIARHVAMTQDYVAFFSVEMSQRQQMFRILAGMAEIDGHKLQCGQLNMLEQQRLGEEMNRFAQSKFALDQATQVTALQVRSRSRRMKARCGLGLIVVDYLQLMQHPRANSREEAVAATGRTLKAIAKELDVPVVALSQLSRAPEQRQDKVPIPSDLRESGSLEQDADVILLIHQPADEEEGGVRVVHPTQLIIGKNRNGPTTTVELRWLKEQYRFLEV